MFWLAVGMALVGAAACLLTPRAPAAPKTRAGETHAGAPADFVTHEFITHETEVVDEFFGAQPLAPTPRIASPCSAARTRRSAGRANVSRTS